MEATQETTGGRKETTMTSLIPCKQILEGCDPENPLPWTSSGLIKAWPAHIIRPPAKQPTL